MTMYILNCVLCVVSTICIICMYITLMKFILSLQASIRACFENVATHQPSPWTSDCAVVCAAWYPVIRNSKLEIY